MILSEKEKIKAELRLLKDLVKVKGEDETNEEKMVLDETFESIIFEDEKELNKIN